MEVKAAKSECRLLAPACTLLFFTNEKTESVVGASAGSLLRKPALESTKNEQINWTEEREKEREAS